ncbi:putative fungal specific transcription protein [Erysiphe neolycopersici]|uniref:Putative fungal specific transcription protein n=1 Tax=Erysiphe neolycopersici TaxID=212602 RepID=A0A420I7A4_9PEZI|nr:putative fungal specific transcription protein [Erysiphe neolycopersici]
MSNPEASIDPLLRKLAPTPSSSSTTYHPSSPIIPGSSACFSRSSFAYERTSPYLDSQHLHGENGANIENLYYDTNVNNPKRSRACEACRGLKVRCEFGPNSLDETCKRCAKANRICVVTAPSRKRRKKTDSRVAELEKKIDALTASLAAQRSGSISITPKSDSKDINEPQPNPNQLRNDSFAQSTNENYISSLKSCYDNHDGEWPSYTKAELDSRSSSTIPSKPTIIDQNVKQSEIRQIKLPSSNSSTFSKSNSEPIRGWLDSTTRLAPIDEYVDVIDRGLLTFEMSSKIFNEFFRDMIPSIPILVFPPGTTSASVRKSTPILFLAILTAGSSISSLHLRRALLEELMKVFSERVLINKYKTIELIQALQVASLWFLPAERIEDVKFYQLRHTAAIIAIEIGMGRKNRSPIIRATRRKRNKSFFHNRFLDTDLIDSESIEPRRTWLSCYLLCYNASLMLRRPNLIHWSSFTADCVEILENSEYASPSDKLLCQWVKIYHISEEASAQFCMNDLGATVSFTDSQVQHTLRGFERDLEKWRACQKHDKINPSLKITEHAINLYIHEVVTQVGHQLEELKPPFNEDTMSAFIEENDSSPISSARVPALSTCLASIDGILGIFLDLDVESIRLFPSNNYGWVVYATVVLMKLYFTAANPNSELGEIINKDSMRVEYYLDRLIDKLSTISGEECCKISELALDMMIMMRNWFHRQNHRHRKPSHQPANSDNQFNEWSNDKETHTIPLSNKKRANYSSGNTMLQLLSEVATGNTVSQPVSSVTNSYPSSTDECRQTSQPTYPSFSTSQYVVHQSYGQGNVNGNIDPSLKMDMEYSNLNGSQGTAFSFSDIGSFISDDTLFGGLINSVFPPNMVFEGM